MLFRSRQRDAAEKGRHVGHKVDRRAELVRHFALVHVVDERVGDKVVLEVRGVVVLGGRSAGAAVAGHAKDTGRSGHANGLDEGEEGELGAGGVAAGVGNERSVANGRTVTRKGMKSMRKPMEKAVKMDENGRKLT